MKPTILVNISSQGQLISKYPFGVPKSTKKPTMFLGISGLVSKQRSKIKKVVQESQNKIIQLVV